MSIPNLRVIIVATSIAIGSTGLIAQTPAPQRAQPIKPGRFRSEEGGADSEARHLRPGEDVGRPISPAITTTATRAASRSGGLTNTPAARSTPSPEELAKMVAQRQQQTIERTPGLSEFQGDEPDALVRELRRNSRPWLVTIRRTAKCPLRQQKHGSGRRRGRQPGRTGRPIRGRTTASTTAVSLAAFPAR